MSGDGLQAMDTEPSSSDIADARARIGKENLVSFVIVASGDIGIDVPEVEGIAKLAASTFDFYELLIVAARPAQDWRAAMAQAAARVTHLRVITIDVAMEYEELALATQRFAIGDIVATVYPGEVTPAELDRMIGLCAAGEHDVVRAVHAAGASGLVDQIAAQLVGRALRLATGRDLAAFPARAQVVTRAALTRLETMGGTLRFFRVLDLPDQFSEGRIELAAPPRRRLLATPGRRLRQTALLVSTAAPRLILGLALLCLALSLTSAAYTGYALLAWALIPDVADGWTSTSVILSLFFCANFAVLAVICLGLLQLLRQGAPDPVNTLASETGGGERFGVAERLNVEREVADAASSSAGGAR